MKIHSIEGNRQMLDGGSMFGNAPKALWSKWITPDSQNRIPLATRALLIQTDDGKNILFETGIGAFFSPELKERYGVIEEEHLLIKNLSQKGLKESDIHYVILSHLHFDHAGGLLSAYQQGEPHLLFSNATYFVCKTHWERAQKPLIREKASFIPLIQQLLKESHRLQFIETSFKNLGIPIHFHFSDGHTIGLLLSEIELPQSRLLFISDLCPGIPWIHLPITMGYDRFPEKIVEEKEKIFESLLEKNGHLFFTHDKDVPCVKLAKDSKGKYYGIPTDLSTLI